MKNVLFLIGVPVLIGAAYIFLNGFRLPIQDVKESPLPISRSDNTSFADIPKEEDDDADLHEDEGAPAVSFSHGHGIAVDIRDASKLYIATHYGVYRLKSDTTLSKIGTSEDDFMGFTVHPTRPDVMFASGHPKTGGNIGVVRSDDAGVTWKKISDGVSGPVDFHALTVSPVNPNLIYGWHSGLQRSEDGGQSWRKIPGNLDPVYRLVAHPKEEATLFAANGVGLWKSDNRGETWNIISNEFNASAALAFGVNPVHSNEMLSYGPKLKLAKSTDGGRTWKTLADYLGGDVVYLFAYDPNNGSTVYALTKNNLLFKSVDGGGNWNKIR